MLEEKCNNLLHSANYLDWTTVVTQYCLSGIFLPTKGSILMLLILFMNCGVQVSLAKEDRWCHTPLSEAERFGHTAVARLLRQYQEAAHTRPEIWPPASRAKELFTRAKILLAAWLRISFCDQSIMFKVVKNQKFFQWIDYFNFLICCQSNNVLKT